ncbi:hypothetical protein THERMOT_1372 [Bathymodiolus thermophilus thioautotrophic gill symbiont]|uniref:Uncharacterized protein n=1 Tax=Bathymodiolus thermophilus thioautotrophic gill symbiont TaxID=2360 RepID=A0A1J5UMQ6_9GAMM|nr:hypothetical protein [Bathymodiolus thermophilus thioautotrophic gill symbiont]AYQ56001.1 hypothetical protein MS2017_0251 [Bathymodiolus thermophilus thioautotrophic gill symbiont]OIR25519.1 hypothetical protein BGC33_06915 [Bathymodiolus thermophilus thioautotrophic gill symbiont]CAB5499200.1 hypothetical protein THERMOS_989 [Bathymodiolus thermophilus thioautotrophic gill symbiont]CAB5501204.1 hypothetical protein THERMOT_1372 [Bathymodiolus thermophilus thioautotrophic gill symbiont]
MQKSPTKSLIVTILLTVFSARMGLFYASVASALVLLVATVIVSVITFGWLFIPYIICIIWVIMAVNCYNKEIIEIAK